MRILAVAAVEDYKNVDAQIAKQTIQPDDKIIFVDPTPAKGIDNRRRRIADNQKRLQHLVSKLDYDLIWQLEGDVDLPENCLETLIKNYKELKQKDKNFGYVSAIQIGRHGLYCIGAWVNFRFGHFESIDYHLKGLQPVEATGFYCLLASKKVWLSGKCQWTNEPYGPDVVWGLSINKRKYVNMDLHIGHIIKSGTILPEHLSTTTAVFDLQDGRWKYTTRD